MRKFGKFIFASLSVAAIAGGAYYLVKNIINKDSNDEFEDFEDDFEDFDLEDEDDTEEDSSKEERGYVTLSFQEEDGSDETNEETKSYNESESSLDTENIDLNNEAELSE